MKDALTVGGLAVDSVLNEIHHGDGRRVAVEPRSMEVLHYLTEHPDEVCSRQQILDGVWGADAFVGEEALSHCIWDLRRAFEDDARKPRFIQTLPRRGYRLVAAVGRPGDLGQGERFRLLEEVGAGAMGVVWKAEDTRLERLVALKFLPTQWCHEPRAKERFLLEAKAAAALDHANVCTLHEIDETADGRLFLVMPFYEGKTLDQILADGPLPWRRAVQLGIQVARGLAAAHEQGIVHRDVKPANLMVLPDDTVKVLDFGVARFRQHATQLTGTELSPGTPAYKSPEQTRGDEVDGRSDVWSLGVVLYEMLGGVQPFRGEYEQAVLHGILERHPEPLEIEGLPDALGEVLQRAMHKEPESRFASMEALIDGLQAVVGKTQQAESIASAAPSSSSTSEVSPVETPVGVAAPGSWRPWAWGALLAVIVLVAAWFGWFGHLSASPLLRLAVLPPQVEGSSPGMEAVASGVLVSTLNTLADMQGLSPVDPSELAGASTASAAALATAADEVVSATVEANGVLCRITLRRLAQDGRVLRVESFEIAADAEPGRVLADAVRNKLRQIFPDRPLIQEVDLTFRDEDYEIFFDVKRRLAAGASVTAEDLETLAGVVETSPNFVEGYLLAADLAWRMARSRRQPELFQRAAEWIRQAEERGGEKPRTLQARLHIALAQEQHDEARAVLDALRRRMPGDVRVLEGESRLLEQQGDLEGAVAVRRRAVELRPSWTLLYRLGDLESRNGQLDQARSHLRQALERSPNNRRILSKLAEIEMIYGDLAEAEAFYQTLLERRTQVNYLTNLGIVYVLLGQAEEASQAYRQALERAPGHPLILMNLAEAEAMAARPEVAEDLYQQVLSVLEDNADTAALGPMDAMMQAVCLAQLGKATDAVRQTQTVLQSHAQNAEVIYQAAAVYALTGDVNAALVNVERALELGIQPRWFEMPAFAALASVDAFRDLLASTEKSSA